MRRRTLAATAVLVLAAAIGGSAHGMYAYVPLEVRLAEADLVVQGTIGKETGTVQRFGRPYVVADLQVTKVLKGPAGTKGVSLAWSQPPQPAGGGIVLVADGPIRYRVGQSGTWILKYDAEQKVHLAEYPGDFAPGDQAGAIPAKLAEIGKFAWSAPAKGLHLAVFVEQQDMRNARPIVNGKPVQAVAQASAFVLVRNAGETSLHVNRYHFDRTLKVELRGPDGLPVPVDPYGQRAPNAPVPAPQKHDFLAVGPGQTRAFNYGFSLGLLQKTGEHSLSVSYASQRDGKELGIDDAWQGELPPTKTTFRTPPESPANPPTKTTPPIPKKSKK